MHEYSIVQALLEQVDREVRARGASGVYRVRIRIGALSGVEVPLLTAAYEVFRSRTVCEKADLEIESVAAHWSCPGCASEFVPGDVLRCDRCGLPARLDAGDEIFLDRIEMEMA